MIPLPPADRVPWQTSQWCRSKSQWHTLLVVATIAVMPTTEETS